MEKQRLTRRDFLKAASLAGVNLALAACTTIQVAPDA